MVRRTSLASRVLAKVGGGEPSLPRPTGERGVQRSTAHASGELVAAPRAGRRFQGGKRVALRTGSRSQQSFGESGARLRRSLWHRARKWGRGELRALHCHHRSDGFDRIARCVSMQPVMTRNPDAVTLASVVRVCVLAYFQAAATDQGHHGAGHGLVVPFGADVARSQGSLGGRHPSSDTAVVDQCDDPITLSVRDAPRRSSAGGTDLLELAPLSTPRPLPTNAGSKPPNYQHGTV